MEGKGRKEQSGWDMRLIDGVKRIKGRLLDDCKGNLRRGMRSISWNVMERVSVRREYEEGKPGGRR